MRKTTIRVASIISMTCLLWACGGNHADEVQEEAAIEEAVEEEVVTDEIDYILPSPLQIAELFKSAGLSYIGDLTSSKDKIEHYNSKYDQKLNLGVYSSDMAYCIINNQTQASIDYLNTIRKLSEKLWMTDVLNSMGLADRLEANVGNEDSLMFIMADLQMQMDEYLDENDMGNISAMIFAGAWIETMYLGVKVNESQKNEELSGRLAEQSVILNSLLEALKAGGENSEAAGLIADLEKINTHFKKMDEDPEAPIKEEDLVALGDDIIKLRRKIVGV